MGKLLLAAVCLLLIQGAGYAEEPVADPIAKKITAAKDAYYAERDKAELALIVLLEKKEAVAKQAGDIKTIETVRAELDAFRKEGKLPKSVPLTTFDTAMKLARKKLDNVYLAAIKTYTQSDDLEKAKLLQADLEKFGKAPMGEPDPLQPNTVWVDIRGADKTVLTIKQRNNDRIQAHLFSNPNNKEKIVTGILADGKISWLAKDTKAIRGDNDVNLEAILTKDDKGHILNVTWKSVENSASGKFQLRLKK